MQRIAYSVCYKNANFTSVLQSKQATRSIFKQTDNDNDFRIRFFEKSFKQNAKALYKAGLNYLATHSCYALYPWLY